MPCSYIDIRHTHACILRDGRCSADPADHVLRNPPTNMGCWFQTYPTYSDRTWLEYDEW